MAYQFPYRISLISTQTASSSASLSFTAGISANFTSYLIKIRNLVPATTSTQILMTWSTNGGSSYLATNYLYSNFQNDSGATRTYGKSAGTTTSIPITLATVSTTAGRDVNSDIILYGLNSATFVPKCMFHSTYYNSAATPLAVQIIGGGMNSGVAAVNAVKFAMSSGNISSGTISLYGLSDGGFIY